MKVKSMSIPDFIRNGWEEERAIDLFIAHLERNKIKYRIVGTTIIVFLGMSEAAFASSGIDIAGKKLYDKLIGVAKWVIIFKGGMDIIKSMTDGDMPGAKKSAMGYAFTFLLLLALPWMLEQIEGLFHEMETTTQ